MIQRIIIYVELNLKKKKVTIKLSYRGEILSEKGWNNGEKRRVRTKKRTKKRKEKVEHVRKY